MSLEKFPKFSPAFVGVQNIFFRFHLLARHFEKNRSDFFAPRRFKLEFEL
jgi:hypothetical protein